MARVLLENVTKIFDGQVAAVSNFNLEVPDGQFMVIVGPSGCGKTTTLRMIAGLESPNSGEIRIGDTRVNDVPPKVRDVAMVFQNQALYPHMTVYQNMAFALKMRKCPKAEIDKRVREAARLLGIDSLLHRKPGALSGGQRQRVAIGRVIVRSPKVFLFDEPLQNLDAKLRLATRIELKGLHRRLRTTTIYVTHDQAEAMSLGDRICVMNEGVIQQTGRPTEVYERPVNQFVAGFLGTPPMNFFEGQIKSRNGATCFVIADDVIVLPERLGAVLKDYYNSEMTLGIRPEDISLKEFARQAGNAIAATVLTVEPFGNKADVCLRNHAGQEFIVSVEPHTRLRVNETVKTYVDLQKVCIFSPGDHGRNIALSECPTPTGSLLS